MTRIPGGANDQVDRSFYFARDVWYHGYVKTIGQQMYLWVREDTGADWTDSELQTTAPLITNGDMLLYAQGDRVRVNLNPMGYYNAQDQLRLRDITIKTWHCAAEIPELPGPCADVIISEVLVLNTSGITDPNFPDEYSGWLEVHNRSLDPVYLEGWGLTDDTASPFKWTFPAVTLSANGYLVLFASGRDLRPTDGSYLHTNFTFGPDGGPLVLTCPDGVFLSDAGIHEYNAFGENTSLAWFEPEGAKLSGASEEGAVGVSTAPSPGTQAPARTPWIVSLRYRGVGTNWVGLRPTWAGDRWDSMLTPLGIATYDLDKAGTDYGLFNFCRGSGTL